MRKKRSSLVKKLRQILARGFDRGDEIIIQEMVISLNLESEMNWSIGK